MTPTCPFCGHQLRPQSRFCAHCGRPVEARLAPGATLKGGDYRIVRSLTKGGMGAVYLAEDRRAFDRLCVIKQMLEYYDPGDPDERIRAQRRFEEEGRTLASLNHPGIPEIYAFFRENGRYYLVMEYIRGENLETSVTHLDEAGRRVPGKRLPREEVIRYTIQVCRILEYLHSQPRAVVHQDLKPANLILESHLGDVRLVDFGTARAHIPKGGGPGHGDPTSVFGTDGYAPPEQYRGKPVPRSDVFSLAATSYHLLTTDDPRDHPFKWPKLNTLPRELALAFQRALRTDPEKRSTARELRQALEALATPQRTLESFTFPGGAQIRSVGALPAHCDEHWDSARSFLYNGDFQRWLRDINRHDLVVAADQVVERYANHDSGLEAFLRLVDPGLPRPKITGDPPSLDLGAIARESAIIRQVTLLNTSRGYTQAKVGASETWIEVRPRTMHLWAGRPVDLHVHIHAEGLPFRSQQRGLVAVEPEGHDPVRIPVTAQVSLFREGWRILRRAVGAALPESWRMSRAAWRVIARIWRAFRQPFVAHPWLIWILWLVLGTAIGAGLYYLPPWAQGLAVAGWPLQRPERWADYAPWVVLGAPLLLAALWLAFATLALVGSLVVGALRGAWNSFFR